MVQIPHAPFKYNNRHFAYKDFQYIHVSRRESVYDGGVIFDRWHLHIETGIGLLVHAG